MSSFADEDIVFDEDKPKSIPLKMYILIKEDVDLGHAILGAAHASLSGYLHFTRLAWGPETTIDEIKNIQSINDQTIEWVNKSFRKVVCKVTQAEFDKAKTYFKEGVDFRVMHESGIFGNPEISIVFAPRSEWPPFFKSLKLYREFNKSSVIKIIETLIANWKATATDEKIFGNEVKLAEYNGIVMGLTLALNVITGKKND